jgi:hypothetical protein
MSTEEKNEVHLVFLIHGIRDRAAWVSRVRTALEIDGFRVCQCGYGYFDVFRFWWPGRTREVPLALVERQIRSYKNAAEKQGFTVKMSAIAHSFGTYLVSRILEDATDLRWERLIFCGAIAPEGFRWDKVQAQVEAGNVINDVGRRDIWPVMAKLLTFGYGDAGTHGFGFGAKDRFHNARHGDYFEGDFPQKFWAPWIHSGRLVPPDQEAGRSRIPGWLGVKGLNWIGFALVLGFLLLLVLGLPWALWTRTWWLVYLLSVVVSLGIASVLPRWWRRLAWIGLIVGMTASARYLLGPSSYHVNPKLFADLRAQGSWDADGRLGVELTGVPDEVALAPNRLRVDVVQGKTEKSIRSDERPTIPKLETLNDLVKNLRKDTAVEVRLRVSDPNGVLITEKIVPIEIQGAKP